MNERILGALLDTVPDLVVLVDSAGRITLFNSACKELTGYAREEALGQQLSEFLVPREWMDVVQQRFADPFSPEVREPHENPWVTKSGEERLIRWRCTALRLVEDDPPYILGIGTDVTEQRRIEEKNRTQSRLLEIFFESTLTCAVLLDRDFNFIRVNQAYARACRRDASEFPGRNHFDLYPSDARRIFDEVIRTKRPYVTHAHPFEFPDHPEWGVTYWDWTLLPVTDHRGEIELLLFCLNDVSERRRAEQGLRDALDQLRVLSQQLVDIQEHERRHIARELHDEVGQRLTALRMALEKSSNEPNRGAGDARVREALAITNDLFQCVRQISFDLRPPMLDDLGLPAALLWLIERHRVQTGLEVAFKHSGLDNRLPQEVETAVYRITQEALTNVARHASVRQAKVFVWVTEQSVVLRIEDQGSGFDPAAVRKTSKGSGLLGMQERAGLLGGSVTVDAGVGAGTIVTAELPRHFPHAS
jgi:PAS domain S-box-containing protein